MGSTNGRRVERDNIASNLEKRVLWLQKEIRTGGDRAYLSLRLEEAQYILESIRSGAYSRKYND